ncbi:helix-turn-helix domain-containing protein [Dysgonomonas sp. ZJ709]|uniref:helix-turn-helix domain-containing protein n=1 Tax=Dysgonomonas sp. ZJ709 TaxID=2709797 RepID=UPI0013EBB0F6|nr:helix-turn-helix transcriptional regulator [Dysgonomonas sp. ZJ709]
MDTNTKVHHGHNIKRLREMLGIKQDTIAFEMNITQQSFSEIEQKEVIDEKVLSKVADIMKVPIEAIKNMTDETTINYINTFNDVVTNNNGCPFSYNSNCTFSPIEKIVELYNEKIELYERMLKDKEAMIEKLSGDKK